MTPVSMVSDYRAGVEIRFFVTGPNSSTIQLFQDNQLIDTKSIAFNLQKIARNYDVQSVDQFCKEWLMPCISIKTQEFITASLDERNL